VTTLYLVMEYDYDDAQVIAAYASETLAQQHADEMDMAVVSVEVSDRLPDEVTDPAAKLKRQQEVEAAKAAYRERVKRSEQMRAAAASVNAPDLLARGGKLSLCACRTFSVSNHFINEHGHCGYCGGFTPEVFKQHLGEKALHEAIDLLAYYDREKMQRLVS
jgi:hypothetical protein